MITDNRIECGCERGGDCTRTTVCQLKSAIEDYVERLNIAVVAIERLADPERMLDSIEHDVICIGPSREELVRMSFAKNILDEIR